MTRKWVLISLQVGGVGSSSNPFLPAWYKTWC